MTKEEMTKLAQKQLDAYNQQDLEAFCSCYHPQVIVTNLLSGSIRCQGKADFTKIYRALFESSPKLHCELKSRIVLEATVMDEEYVTGSSRSPQGIHTVAIYGFRDGLIDRVWFPV